MDQADPERKHGDINSRVSVYKFDKNDKNVVTICKTLSKSKSYTVKCLSANSPQSLSGPYEVTSVVVIQHPYFIIHGLTPFNRTIQVIVRKTNNIALICKTSGCRPDGFLQEFHFNENEEEGTRIGDCGSVLEGNLFNGDCYHSALCYFSAFGNVKARKPGIGCLRPFFIELWWKLYYCS